MQILGRCIFEKNSNRSHKTHKKVQKQYQASKFLASFDVSPYLTLLPTIFTAHCVIQMANFMSYT